MKSPRPIRGDQPRRMWRLRLSALYCVRYKYAAKIAIHAIREGDVDDAVDAAEWDGRFGAVARERPEPLALAAGQEDSDRVAHERHERRYSSAVRTGCGNLFVKRSAGENHHWGEGFLPSVAAPGNYQKVTFVQMSGFVQYKP